MKSKLVAGLVGLAMITAAPAFAQAPAPAPAFSVETTPIGELTKNPAAKAVLETAVPGIQQYYDQISSMTLTQVAPMSQGALDDAKLKAIQADLDKLPK